MRGDKSDFEKATVLDEPANEPTLLEQVTAKLTFVAADPPRNSWLGLWTDDSTIDLEGLSDLPVATIDLIRPLTGGTLVRTSTEVIKVSMSEAIELLANPPRRMTASAHVYSNALRWVLTAISQGQIEPSITARGIDTWRLAVSDADAKEAWAQLASALPLEGHCVALDASPTDLLVPTPAATMSDFGDAIADSFLRTPESEELAGHAAFAVSEPVQVRAAPPALKALTALNRTPLVTLRVGERDDRFIGTVTLQSRSDASIQVPAAAMWRAGRLGEYQTRSLEQAVLLTLRRAARLWPPADALLEQPEPSEMELSEFDLEDLLGPLGNDLGAAGLGVLVPEDLFATVELTPIIAESSQQTSPRSSEAPAEFALARLDLASLMELRWNGTLNGVPLTDDDLSSLAEAKSAVIRLHGTWVRVDSPAVKRLNNPTSISTATALAAALGTPLTIDGEEHAVTVEGPLARLGERLRHLDTERTKTAPDSMDVDLRPYQERGLAWLGEMDQLGLGGVLADDMGLGKTVQLIARHVERQQLSPSPTLVVCPASVVGNWERETNRFAPDITVHRYHGATRGLAKLEPGDIVLTTYGVARRDAQSLGNVGWGLLVVDEAQAIKNPRSRTAKALRTIKAEARFALTGTPVQNNLTDLWAILDWTTPGLLGPLARFQKEVINPVEKHRDAEATASLNHLIRPFVLRRRKSDPDIAPDLPPKTETDELVQLTAEQAVLYKGVVNEVMTEIATSAGIARNGLVLRLITRLKQICNHPEHYLAEGGDLAGRSGKLTATTDLIETIASAGDKTLVFTQYVQMGLLLQKHLESVGMSTLFLHGQLSIAQRDEMVEQFQAGEADVFVVSLKAGGVGLNLTAATHVIHYDRWWNPAVEDQASDRAWRIGQDRPVQIHRLVCEGTVEDRISVLLQQKRELADAVVGSGEGWISSLTDDELAELVALSDETVAAVTDPGDDADG